MSDELTKLHKALDLVQKAAMQLHATYPEPPNVYSLSAAVATLGEAVTSLIAHVDRSPAPAPNDGLVQLDEWHWYDFATGLEYLGDVDGAYIYHPGGHILRVNSAAMVPALRARADHGGGDQP